MVKKVLVCLSCGILLPWHRQEEPTAQDLLAVNDCQDCCDCPDYALNFQCTYCGAHYVYEYCANNCALSCSRGD